MCVHGVVLVAKLRENITVHLLSIIIGPKKVLHTI